MLSRAISQPQELPTVTVCDGLDHLVCTVCNELLATVYDAVCAWSSARVTVQLSWLVISTLINLDAVTNEKLTEFTLNRNEMLLFGSSANAGSQDHLFVPQLMPPKMPLKAT